MKLGFRTVGVVDWIFLAPDAPILMDAVFANQDEEHLDAVGLEQLIAGQKQRDREDPAGQ